MSDRPWAGYAILLVVSFVGSLSAQHPEPWHDPSPHTIQFVTVDENVKLEVLDWGGSGRPLVLLAGLGNTAHIFDDFAPKLTSEYHVYGITRRGYGNSSSPLSGYSADRLGDDVLAVLDALKLNRPVLVGHSIAGEELSSVETRHPERVAGLVYLDAISAFAFYDRSRGDFSLDLQELQRNLEQLKRPPGQLTLAQELLRVKLPQFERDLQQFEKVLQAQPPQPPVRPNPTADDLANFSAFRSYLTRVNGFTEPEGEVHQRMESRPDGGVGEAHANPASSIIVESLQKYTNIRGPVLAICAIPHERGPFAYNNSAERTIAEAMDTDINEAEAKSFETGVPSARVIRLPHANHYVFITNEAEVLREMRAFLADLH